MTGIRDDVTRALSDLRLPDGSDPVSRDLIRALMVEGGKVSLVIEAASPDDARSMAGFQARAETAIGAIAGVKQVLIAVTAHAPSRQAAPPNLKIGQHPTPQQGTNKPNATHSRRRFVSSS